MSAATGASDRPVLLVCSSAEIYGSDRAALDLAVDLRDFGREVTMVLPEHGPMESLAAEKEIRTIRIPLAVLRRRSLIGSLRSMARLPVAVVMLARLAGKTPYIVHSNTSHVLEGAVVAQIRRLPHVWHFREIHDDQPLAAKALASLAAILSRRILCISGAVRNSHVSQLPPLLRGRSERFVVVPDGIRVSEFDMPDRDYGSVGPLPLLAYGRIARWKGYHILLDALRLVRDRGGSLMLTVVGGPATLDDESYHAELRENVRCHGLPVEFTGPTVTVQAFLSGALVVVLPSSRPEPFGRVVLEAMASGSAVVATAAGGPAEIITDGVDGLLVPISDAGAMAAALERLAGDSALRESLGRSAVRTVRERFSSNHCSLLVQQTYRELE